MPWQLTITCAPPAGEVRQVRKRALEVQKAPGSQKMQWESRETLPHEHGDWIHVRWVAKSRSQLEEVIKQFREFPNAQFEIMHVTDKETVDQVRRKHPPLAPVLDEIERLRARGMTTAGLVDYCSDMVVRLGDVAQTLKAARTTG